MDVEEIGWKGVDWLHLAQDRGQWWVLVNTHMIHYAVLSVLVCLQVVIT